MSVHMTVTLPAIITAARAGSLDRAWALFTRLGYDELDDPATLAVKGRLLKDRALRLAPSERAGAFVDAGRAYAAADALSPQPYTKINVATLALLSGDAARAAALAGDLLAWLDRAQDIAETPYYLGATRAEAHLLRGERGAAEAEMGAAIAADDDGWADHASTIRQLALISGHQGIGHAWLDAFRPPASLHFAGHLGVAAGDSAALGRAVSAVLAKECVGFGYGALAAGADLVIAEALLEAGAELHVVLPTGAGVFVAQSVAPYGAEWVTRFDACMDAAASVRTITGVTGAYEPLATQLAADVAMGSAVLNARQLESRATQLLVVDDAGGGFGAGIGTARDGERWRANGCTQHVIAWPRSAPVVASGAKPTEGRADRRLAAMLRIGFEGLDGLDEGAFADAVDNVLTPFRAALATLAVQPDLVLPSGNARIVAFADPMRAWRYAEAVLALPTAMPLRIGGHYALGHWLGEPAALVGPGVADLDAVAAGAIPGVLTVSETFASAVFASCDTNLRAEWIGEAGTMRLFAIAQ